MWLKAVQIARMDRKAQVLALSVQHNSVTQHPSPSEKPNSRKCPLHKLSVSPGKTELQAKLCA